jgi:hypothetical protein
LLPPARLLPFTVRVAVTVPLEPASGAVPRAVFPAEKVTLPVGAVVPLAAFTVTVKTVDALCTILTGSPAREAVVAIRGADRVTVIAVETELVKPPLPA